MSVFCSLSLSHFPTVRKRLPCRHTSPNTEGTGHPAPSTSNGIAALIALPVPNAGLRMSTPAPPEPFPHSTPPLINYGMQVRAFAAGAWILTIGLLLALLRQRLKDMWEGAVLEG